MQYQQNQTKSTHFLLLVIYFAGDAPTKGSDRLCGCIRPTFVGFFSSAVQIRTSLRDLTSECYAALRCCHPIRNNAGEALLKLSGALNGLFPIYESSEDTFLLSCLLGPLQLALNMAARLTYRAKRSCYVPLLLK